MTNQTSDLLPVERQANLRHKTQSLVRRLRYSSPIDPPQVRGSE